MSKRTGPISEIEQNEMLASVGAPSKAIVDHGSVALKRMADDAILRVEQQATKGGYGAKLRNMTPEPLDYYYHRNQISKTQFKAGDHMRVLHYAAHGSGIAKTNYEAFGGVKTATDNWQFSNRQAFALRRWCELMGALDRTERLMVERVVYWGEFANHVAERRLGINPRHGIGLLRDALDKLDTFQNEGIPQSSDRNLRRS